jgi:hypothetical protein
MTELLHVVLDKEGGLEVRKNLSPFLSGLPARDGIIWK